MGSSGERRKLLVLHNFSDFVVVGRMQSGKSMLLRALSAAATSNAAATNPGNVDATAYSTAYQRGAHYPDAVTDRRPGEHQQQHQQRERQQQQWLSAAVPDDVWLPTAEPTVCVIPAPTSQTAKLNNLAPEQMPSVHQQQQQDGLVGMLQQGVALASGAPIVAVDTPGLLPPAASPVAAAAATAGGMLAPAGQLQEEPLQGLSAATAVLFVVDSSQPVRTTRIFASRHLRNSTWSELPLCCTMPLEFVP